MSINVKYVVNGAVSTVWSRIFGSKTTYVVVAFVLARAESLLDGPAIYSLMAWREAGITALVGAALILIRSAQAKAELAANASNENVTGVKAVQTPGKGKSVLGTAGIMAVMAGLLGLSGCSGIKGLTTPDGKPVTLPPVCYTSSAGQTCYNSDGSVTFTPAPPAPAPLPVQLEK